MTALVTPFHHGEVDWPRLNMLVDRQLEGGTQWLVACGTTGESPTLTRDEHDRIVAAVISRADGRCPVMVGTGTNNTAETIRRTRQALTQGADAALIVAPYYNRPTAEGLYRHYAAIADAVALPIVLYNVPLRTGVFVDNDVVVRLRERYSHIVAIKQATGSVEGVSDLLSRTDISVLSGDDAITWPLMALGAVGVISVISNLVPAWMKSLVSAAREGSRIRAEQYHQKVVNLSSSLGRWGPNPLPIKTAMAIAGLIDLEFRLPLCPLDDEARKEIEKTLCRLQLVESVTV